MAALWIDWQAVTWFATTPVLLGREGKGPSLGGISKSSPHCQSLITVTNCQLSSSRLHPRESLKHHPKHILGSWSDVLLTLNEVQTGSFELGCWMTHCYTLSLQPHVVVSEQSLEVTAWQCPLSCSRQEDRPLVAGLFPSSRGSHLPSLPLCGLAWTPPDETQAARRPQSRPHCLQLRHGRPVGLHVPWGVREHWFLAGAANQSQGPSVFSLYPDQSSQGFFLCVSLCVRISTVPDHVLALQLQLPLSACGL